MVGIDHVIDQKRTALEQMPSQFSDVDSWTYGRAEEIPVEEEERMSHRLNNLLNRNVQGTDQYRDFLIELYGEEEGSRIRHAESFELSEYGRHVSVEELKRLFPGFD